MNDRTCVLCFDLIILVAMHIVGRKFANFLSTGTWRRFYQSTTSTIYALSTNIKNSGSAIAVVRVSGPSSLSLVGELTKKDQDFFRRNERKALLQSLFDRQNSDLIDKAMVIYFAGPRSYTGEDMVEFHLHGSQAVITKLLTVLGQSGCCRSAKEGEFTKRALLNGKLGLIEAEGVRDLIEAKTETQRRRALSVVGDDRKLQTKLANWRTKLLTLLAHLEANIDFGEEELIDEEVMSKFKKDVTALANEIAKHVRHSKQKSDLIKDGFRVAIVGEANVGKSSLINRICEQEVSIISPISGTTRDVVQTWLDIGGYSVCIADTAGIKEPDVIGLDPIERQGILKAIERAKQCHLVILLLDASRPDIEHLPSHLQTIVDERTGQNLVVVINKIDLSQSRPTIRLNNASKVYYVSCATDEGVADFINGLSTTIENFCGEDVGGEESLFSDARHLQHFEHIQTELAHVERLVNVDLALAASHLQQAVYNIECLTGRITTDDVLDIIFRDFCIGK